MKKLISCEYNFDNCCVELKFTDGSMIAIDTIAVENEVARNMYERSELDYLIYNDPIAYADLILNGNPEAYLMAVTEYKPLENFLITMFRTESVIHEFLHHVVHPAVMDIADTVATTKRIYPGVDESYYLSATNNQRE